MKRFSPAVPLFLVSFLQNQHVSLGQEGELPKKNPSLPPIAEGKDVRELNEKSSQSLRFEVWTQRNVHIILQNIIDNTIRWIKNSVIHKEISLLEYVIRSCSGKKKSSLLNPYNNL